MKELQESEWVNVAAPELGSNPIRSEWVVQIVKMSKSLTAVTTSRNVANGVSFEVDGGDNFRNRREWVCFEVYGDDDFRNRCEWFILALIANDSFRMGSYRRFKYQLRIIANGSGIGCEWFVRFVLRSAAWSIDNGVLLNWHAQSRC